MNPNEQIAFLERLIEDLVTEIAKIEARLNDKHADCLGEKLVALLKDQRSLLPTILAEALEVLAYLKCKTPT